MLTGDVRLPDRRERIAGPRRLAILGEREHEPPIGIGRTVGVLVDSADAFQSLLGVRKAGEVHHAGVGGERLGDEHFFHWIAWAHPLQHVAGVLRSYPFPVPSRR